MSEQRRIAFIITRSDAPGGAQFQVLRLAAALRDEGHEVRVFVGGRGPFVQLLEQAQVEYASLEHLVRPIAPLTDLRGLLELRRAMIEFKPDLLSAHSTKAGWLGRAVGQWLGVPTVFTVHGQPLSPGPLAPARRVLRRIDQVAATMCHSLIFVSDYDLRVAREHGVGLPHQRCVVHNGVPDVPPELRADPSRSPPTVGMVARLDRPKDPMLALEAFASLRDLPWRFVLIGDGPLRADVEARAAQDDLRGRVELTGAVDDVPRRLADLQVFLLASRREGLPISVLEAMRAGLPVVTTDAGGVSEAVLNGTTGFVTPRDDAPALASALRALISSAQVRAKVGAASRARYESAFAFPNHVRETWGVYRRAMDEA